MRAAGRAETRAAGRSSSSPASVCRDRPLVARRAARRARGARGRAAVPRREPALGRGSSSCPSPGSWTEVPSDRIEVPPGADGLLAIGGGSAIDTAKAASSATGLPLVSVPTTYSGRRVDAELRRPHARPPDRRRRRRRAARGDRLRRRSHARPAAARDRRDGAERARPLRRGALRAPGTTRRATSGRSQGARADRRAGCPEVVDSPHDREARGRAAAGARRAPARRSRSPGSRSGTRSRRRSAAPSGFRTAR